MRIVLILCISTTKRRKNHAGRNSGNPGRSEKANRTYGRVSLTSLKRNCGRELEKETLREGFWNEPDKAREILQEQSRLNEAVAKWKRQKNNLDDLALLCDIASEEEDEHTQEEIEMSWKRFRSPSVKTN